MSGMMSSTVGWAIQQGKAVEAPEGREDVMAIKESLQGIYQGRILQNWGLLLFFLKKVNINFIFCRLYVVNCVHNILTQFGI